MSSLRLMIFVLSVMALSVGRGTDVWAQEAQRAPDAQAGQAADGQAADGSSTETADASSTSETEQAASASAPPAAQADTDDDMVLRPAEPDFTVINLPTTLRLPRHKSAFRVTHRFARSWGDGDFGELLEDFFGLDSGALIGLEYRFGIIRGGQIGIHRNSDRTIEFFGQYSIWRQTAGKFISVDALATIEGINNFRENDSYSPALGAILSRTLGEHAAVYAVPIWINNTSPLPSELVDDNSTFLLGLGGRFRVLRTVYVLAEVSPRLAGYDPDKTAISFGLEKRLGGHSFQVNFSNTFATTWANIARGGATYDDWYLGFNITRKFY